MTMSTSVRAAIQRSYVLEQELGNQLGTPNCIYAQIEPILDSFREVCLIPILEDAQLALVENIEERAWNAHQKVNHWFRKSLAEFKNGAERRIVEKRKLSSQYLKFIKQSQRWYRALVLKLATTNGGIPELQELAGRLIPEPDGISHEQLKVASINKQRLIDSCHRTLIQLGDLSRYREMELGGEARNWAPAIGFYDLARMLCPSSGISHNQLAVVALQDGSPFRATYHLYRALSASEPHPQAEANLEKQFRNISNAAKSTSISNGTSSVMIKSYLRLLAVCHKGQASVGFDELENEFANHLVTYVRNRPADNTLRQVVLVNVAAGHAAQERFQGHGESEECMRSYLYFLRLNVRTSTVLLSVTEQQLRKISVDYGSEAASYDSEQQQSLITTLSTTLPSLYLYSLWLQKNVAVIASPVDLALASSQKQFWIAYAAFLTQAAIMFPADALEDINYMLEEELDTLGFNPLSPSDKKEALHNTNHLKATRPDNTANLRNVMHEIRARIRRILITGLQLAFDDNVPITFDQDRYSFLYHPIGDSSESLVATATTNTVAIIPTSTTDLGGPEAITAQDSASRNVTSSNPVEENLSSLEIDAERMVDNLVGPAMESPVTVELAPDAENDLQQLPQHTFHESLNTSPFPVGTHTANDLLEAVRNFSQNRAKSLSPRSISRIAGQHSQPPSQHASPALSQAHLRVASANPPRPAEDKVGQVARPSTSKRNLSPATGAKTPRQALPLTLTGSGSQTSPLLGRGSDGHSRVQSLGSNQSKNSIWMPDESWSSSGPSMSTPSGTPHLGNGTFGALDSALEAEQHGMGSSLLFSGRNSPWSVTQEEGTRLSGSSPQLTRPMSSVMHTWPAKTKPLT